MTECINPSISILTVYRNSKEYFDQTVKCILNQTYLSWEWIVVCNENIDNKDVKVLEEIRLIDNRIRVIHKKYKNMSELRYQAIRECNQSSKYLLFLDDGDLLDRTYLECAYWTLNTKLEVSCVYSAYLYKKGQYELINNIDASLFKRDAFSPIIFAARKEDILEIDQYDDKIILHYKWFLILNLIKNNKKLCKLSDINIYKCLCEENIDSVTLFAENKILTKIARNISVKYDNFLEFPMRTFSWQPPHQLPYEKFSNSTSSISDNKKINILFILPSMLVGGADKFNLELIKRINKDSFNAYIVTTDMSNNVQRCEFEKYSEAIYDLNAFLDRKDWTSFLHYLIQDKKINVIFNTLNTYGYYILPWLKKEFDYLHAVDYIHLEEMHLREGAFARDSSIVDDALTKSYVCSKHLKNVLVNEFNKNPNNIETVYIGVDEREFNPTHYKELIIRKELNHLDKKVILFPCRIEPQKRPLLMLKIANEIRKKDDNIVFWVVGDGRELSNMKRMANKLKLSNHVAFFGMQQDLRQYYFEADATLICSIKEGLTLTAFESLAMNTPVISSDVGGQKELIDDTVGSIVPCLQNDAVDYYNNKYTDDEINLYVDAILNLVRNDKMYNSCKNNCRPKILEQFTIERMVEKMEYEFVELVENKQSEANAITSNLKQVEHLVDNFITLFNNIEEKHRYKLKYNSLKKKELYNFLFKFLERYGLLIKIKQIINKLIGV